MAPLPADPKRMLANGEDGVHRLVCAPSVDADGARFPWRQRHRRGVRLDGELRQVDVMVDEERLEVDLFDLVRVHHSGQQGGLAAGQPLAANTGCDRVRKPYRDYAWHVVSL